MAKDGDAPSTLVTGCAGFVGSHLARRLQDDGARVIGLDNLSTGSAANLPLGIDFFQGDVGEPGLLDELFSHYRVDRIFHCAAFASEGLSHYARELCFRTNIIGTAALINAAVKSGTVRLFCFISSVALYGMNAKGAVETQAPAPVDPYGISKLASELDLQAAGQQFGLPFLILRMHNLYGPGQNLTDRFRNVIAIYLRNALLDLEFPIFGDGGQLRQFTFIEDVVPLICELAGKAEARGHAINLGASEAVSINALARLVVSLTGRPVAERRFEQRHEAVHCEVSHSRLESILERIIQFTPLREGLLRTLEWARTVTDLELRDAYPVELEELPAVWRERAARGASGNSNPSPEA